MSALTALEMDSSDFYLVMTFSIASLVLTSIIYSPHYSKNAVPTLKVGPQSVINRVN